MVTILQYFDHMTGENREYNIFCVTCTQTTGKNLEKTEDRAPVVEFSMFESVFKM